MSEKYELHFFQKSDGSKPVEEFLLNQNLKVRAKAGQILQLLSRNGIQVREPYSKYLSDGIFEIRIDVGKDASRILYFFLCRTKYHSYEWF